MSEFLTAVLAVSAPLFSFGVTGGNIKPTAATISRAGTVALDGAPTGSLSRPQLVALDRLARKQSFFSLPTSVRCARVLPDVASRYIRIVERGRSRTVTVHGGCSIRFNRVYRALARAAGLPG